MKLSKLVEVDAFVAASVDFELEDVHAFIEAASTEDVAAIAVHLKDYLPGFTYQPTSIMEELATKELTELLKSKGAEAILAAAKQHL